MLIVGSPCRGQGVLLIQAHLAWGLARGASGCSMSLLMGRANPVSEVGWGLGREPTPCGQSWILPPPNARRQLRQMRFRPNRHFSAHLLGTDFSLEQIRQAQVIVRRLAWRAGRASRPCVLGCLALFMHHISAPSLAVGPA